MDYAYDGYGRLVTETHNPGGYVKTYGYDQRSRLVSVSDGSFSNQYTYDVYGRVTIRTDSLGRTLTFAYDGLGRLASRTESTGAGYSFGYDSSHRLTTVTRTGRSPTGVILTLQYDALGRVSQRTLASGVRQNFEYDGASRIARMSVWSAAGVILRERIYTRDGAGRILEIHYLNGDVESFGYDTSGQLVSAARTGSVVYAATFAYDGQGNLLQEVMNGATTTYTYDALGQLVTRTTTAGTETLTYDPRGRITTISRAGGSTVSVTYTPLGFPGTISDSATGQVVSYTYDPGGNRLTRTINGTTRSYLRDLAGNVIGTFAGSNVLETAFARGTNGRLWFENGSSYDLLAEPDTDSVFEVRDALGALVEAYAYDPFGVTIAGPSAPLNAFQFQGLEYDAATSSYDNRVRLYSPAYRRFLNLDPISPLEQTDSYVRTGNDPVNLTDPWGVCTVGSVSVTDAGHVKAEFKEKMVSNTAALGDSVKLGCANMWEVECSDPVIKYVNPILNPPCYPEQTDHAWTDTSGDFTVTLQSWGLGAQNRYFAGRSRMIVILPTAEADIEWHENGHRKLQEHAFKAYLDVAIACLAGIRSNITHYPQLAKDQVKFDWDQRVERIKSGLKAFNDEESWDNSTLGDIHGASYHDALVEVIDAPQEHKSAHGAVTYLVYGWAPGSRNPRPAGLRSHYGPDANATAANSNHNTSPVMQKLIGDAVQRAKDAAKEFGMSDCECKHTGAGQGH